MLLGLVTCLCSSAFAAKIAVIKSADIPPFREAIKGFKQSFDGTFEQYVLKKGKKSKNTELFYNVQQSNVDAVFALGTKAAKLTHQHLSKTPIVFAYVLNPDKLKDSGGNTQLSGIRMAVPPREQFKTLKNILPNIKRVGVIYDPEKTEDVIIEARLTATVSGLTLIEIPIFTKGQAIGAISSLNDKVDAFWMVPDSTLISKESLKHLFLFSIKNKIPVIGISKKYVKYGALFAVSFDNEDMGRQAGELLNNIGNKKAADTIPLESPRKFNLAINLKIANRLGINIDEEIVEEATDVIH